MVGIGSLVGAGLVAGLWVFVFFGGYWYQYRQSRRG